MKELKINKNNYFEYFSIFFYFFIVSLLSLIFISSSIFFISNISFLELLIIPFVFIFGSFVEYSVHRWIMHKNLKFKIFKKIYKNHSGIHHKNFTDNFMNILNKLDVLETLTKLKTILFITFFIILPMSIGISVILTSNCGFLFFSCSVFYYLCYEAVHLICHIDDKYPLFKIKYFKNAKERHKKHHNTKIMRKYNFNVLFPLFDILFKTLKK